MNKEFKIFLWLLAGFLAAYFLPVHSTRFQGAVQESLWLARWYAREHVILCLVPAFFIAGAIGVFVSQAAVMKYLGAKARKSVAYGVASVSGSILAVCSCTVLPLFAGIWRMGAGLGPATTFLYAGPAINVLAIILTARILGLPLGIARVVGAIGFSVLIGLSMHLIFRKEEAAKVAAQAQLPEPETTRPLWKNAVFFGLMVAILVFANWGAPNDFRFETADGAVLRAAVILEPEHAPPAMAPSWRLKALDGERAGQELWLAENTVVARQAVPGLWTSIWQNKWRATALFSIALGLALTAWFGIARSKLLLAALPPLILALLLPGHGLWVLLPFSAGLAGLSLILFQDRGEGGEWASATWGFAKQIMPLLLFGVLAAGFFLGRPGREGIIPGRFVQVLVGATPDAFLTSVGWDATNGFVHAIWPLWTNLFASVFGAFMYFATLTEVPILQGLLGSGMGQGPALALLLAGPALSLPNMLVIRSVMGTKKTVVFVALVVVMSTIAGMIFGAIMR